MPPQHEAAWPLEESDTATEDKGVTKILSRSVTDRKIHIVWSNVILIFSGHVLAVYGGYVFFTAAMWKTWAFTILYYVMSALGVLAGAHRLWSHKSYKARLPLRILLLIFFCAAGQGHLLKWTRSHRTHHKYADTDADPTNSTRGFFFAHMGWLFIRKHPEIMAKAHTIRNDDLYNDPLIQFQRRYFVILMAVFTTVLPSLVPTLWGETLWAAFFSSAFRFLVLFHVINLINSAAHLWGDRPYDKNVQAVEIKPVSFMAVGEGFHNFHHTFPWDYKAAELGGYTFNISKLFIDGMAKIGWAYDLKSVSADIVEKRAKRTGDGSHDVWGWDDAPADDKLAATIDNRVKSDLFKDRRTTYLANN